MELIRKIHRSKMGVVSTLERPDWTTIDSERVLRRIERLDHLYVARVEKVAGEKPTFKSLVVVLEDLEDRISTQEEVIEILNSERHGTGIQELQARLELLRLKRNTFVATHEGLHRAHRSFGRTRAYKKLEKEERVACDLRLGSFRTSGFHLQSRVRKRLERYEGEIATLVKRFSENLEVSLRESVTHVEKEEQLSGLAPAAVVLMKEEASRRGMTGWVALATSEFRNYVLSQANHRPLREAVYRAYAVAASDIGAGGPQYDNRPVLERILLLRHRYARCFGKKSYADWHLESLMVGSVKNLRAFLAGIARPIKRNLKKDLRDLDNFCKVKFRHELRPWDLWYVTEKYLKDKYGHTARDAQFTLAQSLKVLFRVVRQLFGCRIVESHDVRAWDPSVRFFEVFDHTGELIGGFYLDPFERPGKTGQVCYSREIVARLRKRGTIRCPLVLVNLGFANRICGKEARLNHEDIVLLFHEVGHMLESLLGKANYLATGSSMVEGDMLEFPSLFLQNWAWDVEVVEEMAHVGRRRVPFRLLLALHRQRSFQESVGPWGLASYLQEAIVDLELHSVVPTKGCVGRVMSQVNRDLGFPTSFYLEERKFPNNMALYCDAGCESTVFTYLWAWRFAAAARMMHVASGRSVDPRKSRRLRREYFEASSTRTAKESLQALFGGRLPSSRAMLELGRMI